MPFDQSNLSLRDTLELAGIRPVPNEVLEAHKAEQLRLHPGSWVGRHLALSRLFFVIAPSVIAWVTVLDATYLPDAYRPVQHLVGCGALMCVLLMILLPIEVRTPATWDETTGFTRSDIPESVLDVARRGRSAGPTALFVLGKLRQNSVVLDPYLLLVRGNERVCLAIWDGDTVLHIAEEMNDAA